MSEGSNPVSQTTEDEIVIRIAEDGRTVQIVGTKTDANQPAVTMNFDRYDLDAVIGGLIQCRDVIDRSVSSNEPT